MNYKLCELYNKYTIWPNTNKITFHSNSFLFAWFSIALECCKYARMRFHCATVLVVLSICALRGNIADDEMQMDVRTTLYPFYTTKEMPHVTVTITKNASLAAVPRYISITTIYSVGHLRIFNEGNLFSSKHCHDMYRKKHWIAMRFSTKTQILTFIYLASRAAPNWYIQLNMFLKISGELPGCSPPDCGISWQDLSVSLRNKSSKRLGWRPKRSIKSCYTNRTIK